MAASESVRAVRQRAGTACPMDGRCPDRDLVPVAEVVHGSRWRACGHMERRPLVRRGAPRRTVRRWTASAGRRLRLLGGVRCYWRRGCEREGLAVRVERARLVRASPWDRGRRRRLDGPLVLAARRVCRSRVGLPVRGRRVARRVRLGRLTPGDGPSVAGGSGSQRGLVHLERNLHSGWLRDRHDSSPVDGPQPAPSGSSSSARTSCTLLCTPSLR